MANARINERRSRGDRKSAAALAETLTKEFGTRTLRPDLGDGYDLLELFES